MENKMKKFLILSVLLLIGRIFDVFTTYKYIPDLKGETNPLVSILGFGWTVTLIIQVFVLVLLIYCIYIYSFKKVKTLPIERDVSLKEFISIFNFNNPNDFTKIFYKIPTNRYAFAYSIGAIISKSLITISFIVGTSTTLLIFSEEYKRFYKQINGSAILWVIFIIIVISFTYRFYKIELKNRTNK